MFVSTMKTGIGGVIRDNDGKWLLGYAMKIGMAKIFRVDALAILKGMKLAWQNGYKQVEVNCENVLLVGTICNGFAPISDNNEVRQIHEWGKKN